MSPRNKQPPDIETVEDSVLRRKLLTVPFTIVEKALTLYVILTDRHTPAWVRALVVAALTYLINPLDAVPDALPGIGLTDDLAVLALTLERLSRYVTPKVESRVKNITPRWLTGEDESKPKPTTKPKAKARSRSRSKKKKGTDHAPKKEEDPEGDNCVPFIERFRILP